MAAGEARIRSDYRELLLADYLPLNNRLAQFYGVDYREMFHSSAPDWRRKVMHDSRATCTTLMANWPTRNAP